MKNDFRDYQSLIRNGIPLGIKCVLTVAPCDNGVDIGWENRLDSCVSRLLADVHGHIARRVLGQQLVLGDRLRAAHQVHVGGVHVPCTSMAAGVKENALPAKQLLHVEGLVDFELVDTFS